MEGLIWLGIVIVFSIVKAVAGKSSKKSDERSGGNISPLSSSFDTSLEPVEEEKPTFLSALEKLGALMADVEEPEVKLAVPPQLKKKPVPVLPKKMPVMEEPFYAVEKRVVRSKLQEAIIWKEILDKPVSLR